MYTAGAIQLFCMWCRKKHFCSEDKYIFFRWGARKMGRQGRGGRGGGGEKNCICKTEPIPDPSSYKSDYKASSTKENIIMSN